MRAGLLLFLCALALAAPRTAGAQACGSDTFRDEFGAPPSFSNNDGSVNWAADWVEVDGAGAGPNSGNARTQGGELGLDDRPNTGGQPSLARQADLTTYTGATLSFNWRTTGGVDSGDSVVIEISSNGGGLYILLENFTGLSGTNSGSRTYNIDAYQSANTRIRFRVNNAYGGNNERFFADDVEIAGFLSCTPHFEIVHDGAGDICQAEAVTLSAHLPSHAVDAGYLGTATLSTSTGNGAWILISGSGTLTDLGGGAGTYVFAPADAGQVVLGLADGVAETVNINVTDGTQSEGPTEDPNLTFSGISVDTVRDEFNSVSYSANDGSQNWDGNWIERDDDGAPGTGNVQITGGEVSLDDFPNTNGDPSLEREADLSLANAARFSFDWRTTSGVDANDSILIEVSSNGGASWTLLEDINGINGAVSGSRAYDITPYMSADTRVRFRVNGLNGTGGSSCCYGASGEQFLVDDVQIQYSESLVCGADHFTLSHDGAGIHCAIESITLTARDGSGAVLTSYNQQITIDTQSGRGTWSLVSGNGTLIDATPDDGLATYAFVVADGGSVVLGLDYSQGTPLLDVDAWQTGAPTIRDDDTEGTIAFAPSGFTVTATPLSNPPPSPINDPIPTQIAAVPFTLEIAAFGTTADDPVCGIIESYTGPKTLDFWSSYDDPATGTRFVLIGGTPIGASEPAATALGVPFTNGQASISARYKDVGRMVVRMKDTNVVEPPAGIRGATNPFVLQPADLVVTSIVRVDQTLNPGTQFPTGPVFVAAGEPFGVTVEVRDADGDLTPNYGNETPGEELRIASSTLVAPAGGRNGSADDGTVANATAFTSLDSGGSPLPPGTFYGETFSFDEVGAIRIQTTIADLSYLGTGNVTGTESAVVGRFTPFDFAVALNAPAFETRCAAGGFTYQGEPFRYAAGSEPVINVTARAAAGTPTQNYAGAWWRLTNASLTGRTYAAAVGVLDPVGLPPTTTDPTIVDAGGGTGTLSFSSGTGLAFDRSALAAPFDADISLSIDVIDLDGVAFPANPALFGAATPGNGIAFTAGRGMRFGRLLLENANGSELVPLPMPLRTEFFNGVGFVPNVADVCTSVGAADLLLTLSPPALPTTPSIANDPFLAGDAGLTLSAPGAGNTGTARIETELGVTGANAPWLRYDWPNDGNLDGVFDDNPTGLATFGIFSGDAPVIFVREVY